MIKKLFAICVLFMFTLTGCAVVSLSSEAVLFGKGEIKSHELNVGEFTAVSIYGDFEIVYKYGETTSVVAEMQDNLFEKLYAYVHDYTLSDTEKTSQLSINSNYSLRTSGNNYPKIIITAPRLDDFYIQGSAVMKNSDPLIAKEIVIFSEGTCNIDIDVETVKLYIDISGAGNAKIRGTADNASYTISGSGNIDALDLQTQVASADISGAGKADINCTDKLDVDISGSGSIKYKGNPEINKNISGSGSVKKVD